MLIRRLIAAFLVLASLSVQAYAGCACPMAPSGAPPPCCLPAADSSACMESGNPSGCVRRASAENALLLDRSRADHQSSFPQHHPFDPPVSPAGFRMLPTAVAAAPLLGTALPSRHHFVPLYLETARLRL